MTKARLWSAQSSPGPSEARVRPEARSGEGCAYHEVPSNRSVDPAGADVDGHEAVRLLEGGEIRREDSLQPRPGNERVTW